MESNVLIFVVIGIALFLVVATGATPLFSISGATMERNVPQQASPGDSFNVVYSVSGASGTWGASIVDNVMGGCKFPDGSTTLKTVMLSTEGNLKTIKVIAPASGSCLFSGDYKFGTEPLKDFQDKTTTISENGEPLGGLPPETNGEVPQISLPSIDETLVDLGGFQIKTIHLLIGFGAVVLILILKK